MSANWKSIPGLGKILRIGSALLKAPTRFDTLFAETELQKKKTKDLYDHIEELEKHRTIHIQQIESLEKQIEEKDNQIEIHSRLLEYCEKQAKRITELEKIIDVQSQLMQVMGEPGEVYLNKIMAGILSNSRMLTELNCALSGQPTIWGDSQKLSIAETAAVYTCFFNTNSGKIKIGEYTFAGSRVSILAGSHDKNLKGLLRRDVEITDGCDIVIGDGVWLGSGCTLLGPCQVGDNAVIAAGAVVIPGTCIPDNTVYGGIPARKLSDIDFQEPQDKNNPYILKALRRSRGILFTEGWSDKQITPFFSYAGHWLIKEEGILIAEGSRWILEYVLDKMDSCRLCILFEGNQKEYHLAGKTGSIEINLPFQEKEIGCCFVSILEGNGRIWMTMKKA